MDLTENLSGDQIKAFSAIFAEKIVYYDIKKLISIEDVEEAFEETIRAVYRLGFTDGFEDGVMKQWSTASKSLQDT